MHAREQKLELVSAPTPEPGRQGTAVVVGESTDRSWIVEDRGQQIQARRAASCLLEPALGDRVWIVVEGERCWVLGVLERSLDVQATLRVEGDAVLRVDGKL